MNILQFNNRKVDLVVSNNKFNERSELPKMMEHSFVEQLLVLLGLWKGHHHLHICRNRKSCLQCPTPSKFSRV